jgi:tetratricopeptide (TPR) repeat protein
MAAAALPEGATERLLEELLAKPPDQRRQALQETRFHSASLLAALLAQSQAAQPLTPERSDTLAALAGDLAIHLFRQEPDDEESALFQAQVGNLSGNARRLLGRWEGAEIALGSAAYSLAFIAGPSWEGATFCRYLGLLRWEQGRLDEAEALLRQAARLFRELGSCGEEAVSRVLLGLLSLERDRAGSAVLLLQAGRADLPPENDWLRVRAGLGLALGLAELGHADRAFQILEETCRSFPAITDERELARLPWLEGRVVARLGDGKEAEPLLDMARRSLIAEQNVADGTLCSLDLAAVWAGSGRRTEIPKLLQDLEIAFQAEAEILEVIRRVSRQFLAEIAGISEVPPALVAEAAFTLRRIFRFRGYRVEALPFV